APLPLLPVPRAHQCQRSFSGEPLPAGVERRVRKKLVGEGAIDRNRNAVQVINNGLEPGDVDDREARDAGAEDLADDLRGERATHARVPQLADAIGLVDLPKLPVGKRNRQIARHGDKQRAAGIGIEAGEQDGVGDTLVGIPAESEQQDIRPSRLITRESIARRSERRPSHAQRTLSTETICQPRQRQRDLDGENDAEQSQATDEKPPPNPLAMTWAVTAGDGNTGHDDPSSSLTGTSSKPRLGRLPESAGRAGAG